MHYTAGTQFQHRQKKTSAACTVAAGCGILTLFFAGLAILFPLPEQNTMDVKIKDNILIKQSEVAQWAQIPGTLGYKLDKNLQVTYFATDSTSLSVDASGKKSLKSNNTESLPFQMNRTFANVAYQPTKSIIEYVEDYGYNLAFDWDANSTMITPNFGVLSAWKQSLGRGRADFVAAFKGITLLKKLLKSADIYGRFLAYNLYHYGYKDEKRLKEFIGLNADTTKALYEDSQYGIQTVSGLYRWVRAFMPQDTSNADYVEILDYFQDKLGSSKFNDTVMEQLIGKKSFMMVMNYTLGFRMANILGHTGNVLVEDFMIVDQWGSRRITRDKSLLLFNDPDVPDLKSVLDLYKDDASSELPNNLILPFGFEPEANYYLEEILNFPNSFASWPSPITTLAQTLLLAEDPMSKTTFLNAGNLQFFFERYKLADFEAIKQRFGATLTNDQIIGLYSYFNYIADKLVIKGPQTQERWNAYSAYGTWLSLSLRRSYSQVFNIVKYWAPTRFFAAMVEQDDRDCHYYLKPHLNASQTQTICNKYDFAQTNMSGIYYWALAMNNPDIQASLMKQTNLTALQFASIYNITDQNSIATQVIKTNALLATNYQCESTSECTTDELAMAQYANGSLTDFYQQPESIRGNSFLGGSSLTVSDSWSNKTLTGKEEDPNWYFYPEFKRYLPENTTLNKTTARKLFVDDSTSLVDPWRASLVTNHTLGVRSTNESASVLNNIYKTDDFNVVFDSMRNMIQDYLFNGTAFTNLTKKDYLYGYQDNRVALVFNNTEDYLNGMEVDMQSYITPILTDKSPISMQQQMGIYTGSLSVDNVAKVREINNKDYINRQQSIHDGEQYVMMPVSPSADIQQFNLATNGMQFSPNIASNSSELSIANPELMQVTKFTQDGDKESINDDYKNVKVKKYNAADVDNSAAATLLQGLDVSQTVSNQKMKVQPETGLMLERSQSVDTTMKIHGISKVGSVMEDRSMFLPMPALDKFADTSMPLYSVQEQLTADYGVYQDKFDFVHTKVQTIHDLRLGFAIASGVCGMFFIIATIVACRQKNDEEESGLLD